MEETLSVFVGQMRWKIECETHGDKVAAEYLKLFASSKGHGGQEKNCPITTKFKREEIKSDEA